MNEKTGRVMRVAGVLLGLLVLALSAGYLMQVIDAGVFVDVATAVLAQPVRLAAAMGAYAAAFALRTWAWRKVLPTLPVGQAWAALHVSLLGNHVLPLRMGEVLRITSLLRRTMLPLGPVTASALVLRAGDVLAVLGLAALAAPTLLASSGGWGWAVAAVVTLVAMGGLAWTVRLRRAGADLQLPDAGVILAIFVAWLLESVVVWQVALAGGFDLSYGAAVAVTAVTIAAQVLAVTPGGFGSYEAAATAALVGLGLPATGGFAVALSTHGVKTVYSLVVGGIALFVPAPTYWGRLRLPRTLPARPAPRPVPPAAPVIAMIPVHNEAATVGAVVQGLPDVVDGHPVLPLVVDDGSTDDSAVLAVAAGARVVSQPVNRGLGAAVRRGLAEAVSFEPACVVYLDADMEYDPSELHLLARPVLSGAADYVVGSRFRGQIHRMRRHRRLGNRALTAWVRWMTRRRDLTDGQSGYRAFSLPAAAEAEVIHDYNYAQVLTLDLLGKGFRYAEVPISYAFRRQGRSYIRLWRYLRLVIPAAHRELNSLAVTGPQDEIVPGHGDGQVADNAIAGG